MTCIIDGGVFKCCVGFLQWLSVNNKELKGNHLTIEEGQREEWLHVEKPDELLAGSHAIQAGKVRSGLLVGVWIKRSSYGGKNSRM